jgi:2-methylcitrate dehydratase PrpD
VVVALGLVHGASALTEFPAPLLADERVARLAAVTTLTHDPELFQRHPQGRPTAVALRLRDGTQREVLVPVPLGDARNPLPRGAIRAKALDILGRVRGPQIAEAIVAAAGALADGAPISVLTSALEGQSR